MLFFFYLALFGIACGIIGRAVKLSQEQALRREQIRKLRRENTSDRTGKGVS